MEPDYALCRMPQECSSWCVAKPHGTAHAPLPVAADGIITDLTALVAISASALLVHNGLIRAAGVDCSYLGDVVTSLSRPQPPTR